MKDKDVKNEDCVYHPFVNKVECPPLEFNFVVNGKPVPKTEGKLNPPEGPTAMFKLVPKTKLFRFKTWLSSLFKRNK